MAKFKLEDGTEVEAFTADELQSKLEEETSGLKSKVEELLGESKSAKQKARELEELQAKQEEDALRQREEFKTLYEREQKAKAELAEKYESFEKRIQTKEIEGAAISIASELTRDTKRAELLRKEIMQFARYCEDGVKFEMGGVEVDQDKILSHIKDNYPFLVDGTGASGGGAAGSRASGAGKKWSDMTESEHVELYKRDPAEYRRLRETAS